MTSTPLHFVGEQLREWLVMVPLPVVRLLFLGLLAGVLVWVLTLPRSATTAPLSDGRHGRLVGASAPAAERAFERQLAQSPAGGRRGANLKVGAAIALGLQLVIYWLL